MSNVQLSIGGRGYTIACADGEEHHVAQLGRLIDTRVTTGNLRTQSETRMLLFAALMLADELHEAQQALAAAAAPAETAGLGERVERIADRLEALARQFEDAAS